MDKPTFTDWLIPCSEILPLVGLKRTAWYDGIAAGRFPKPIYLNKRTPRWRYSDIKKLIEEGPVERGRVGG